MIVWFEVLLFLLFGLSLIIELDDIEEDFVLLFLFFIVLLYEGNWFVEVVWKLCVLMVLL